MMLSQAAGETPLPLAKRDGAPGNIVGGTFALLFSASLRLVGLWCFVSVQVLWCVIPACSRNGRLKSHTHNNYL